MRTIEPVPNRCDIANDDDNEISGHLEFSLVIKPNVRCSSSLKNCLNFFYNRILVKLYSLNYTYVVPAAISGPKNLALILQAPFKDLQTLIQNDCPCRSLDRQCLSYY